MRAQGSWLAAALAVCGLWGCAPERGTFTPHVLVSPLEVRAIPGFADETGEATLVDASGLPLRIRADGQAGTMQPHPGNVSAVGEVRAVFPMGPHRSLVAASGGLFVAAGGWVMEPLWSQPLDAQGVVGATESDDGAAWIAHRTGLFRVKEGVLSELTVAGASVQGLTAICAGRAEDGADGIWFADDQGLRVLVNTGAGQLVVRSATLGGAEQEALRALVSLGDAQERPGELFALGSGGLHRLTGGGWETVNLGAEVLSVAGAGRTLWLQLEDELVRFDADTGRWEGATGIAAGSTLLAADASGGAWLRVGQTALQVQRERVPRVRGLNQNEEVALTELTISALFPPGSPPVRVRYQLAGEEQLASPPQFSMGGEGSTGELLPYSLLGFVTGMHTLRAIAEYEDGTQAVREIPFNFQPVDNTPLSWELDVRPIHQERCAKCHDTGPGHTLASYDAWKQEAALISQAIRDRRMPADGPLDPSQSTLIQRWAASGALP